jgi:hypothetical protein
LALCFGAQVLLQLFDIPFFLVVNKVDDTLAVEICILCFDTIPFL